MSDEKSKLVDYLIGRLVVDTELMLTNPKRNDESQISKALIADINHENNKLEGDFDKKLMLEKLKKEDCSERVKDLVKQAIEGSDL